MQDLFQLGMRDAELPAPDRCHRFDGGLVKRVATDHSGRSDDNKTHLALCRNDHDNTHVQSDDAKCSLGRPLFDVRSSPDAWAHANDTGEHPRQVTLIRETAGQSHVQ
jgi:hypothetical protein